MDNVYNLQQSGTVTIENMDDIRRMLYDLLNKKNVTIIFINGDRRHESRLHRRQRLAKSPMPIQTTKYSPERAEIYLDFDKRTLAIPIFTYRPPHIVFDGGLVTIKYYFSGKNAKYLMFVVEPEDGR